MAPFFSFSLLSCWASLVQVKPKESIAVVWRRRPSKFPFARLLSQIDANDQKRTPEARRRASKRSARVESPRGKKPWSTTEQKRKGKKKDAPANVPSPRSKVLLLLLRRRSRAAGGSSARPAHARSCICRRTYSPRTSTCFGFERRFLGGELVEHEGFLSSSSSFFFFLLLASCSTSRVRKFFRPSFEHAEPLTSSRCASLHCPRCPERELAVGLLSCGSRRRCRSLLRAADRRPLHLRAAAAALLQPPTQAARGKGPFSFLSRHRLRQYERTQRRRRDQKNKKAGSGPERRETHSQDAESAICELRANLFFFFRLGLFFFQASTSSVLFVATFDSHLGGMSPRFTLYFVRT